MANFVGLSTDLVNITAECVNSNNRQNIADFLINQQIAIQESVIKNRKETKAKNANTSTGNNSGTGGLSKGKAAFERMKAQGNKK